MPNIIDTRDLQKRLEELESELEDLKEAVNDAEEAYQEAVAAILEARDDEEEADTREERAAAYEALDEASIALDRWRDENQEELDELNNLADEIPDFTHGETLINDDYFVMYAQDLAEDLGMDRNQPWPYSCIDWDRAAEALKMDYSSIEFQGETYWYRG